MFIGMRSVSRLLLLAAASLIMGAAPLPSTHTPPAPVAAPAVNPTASVTPEVRLRKLHLVRPDLILYPIEYEVYC